MSEWAVHHISVWTVVEACVAIQICRFLFPGRPGGAGGYVRTYEVRQVFLGAKKNLISHRRRRGGTEHTEIMCMCDCQRGGA